MTARGHTSYQEEIGAYLLGALTDLERQAFERHMAGCHECRDEIERLRSAADALPRSVEQFEAPRRVKASLMDVVEREAKERSGAPARPRRRLRDRLPGLALPGLRPALVAAALVVGLVAGFGVAELTEEDGAHTIAADVDKRRLPLASGRLHFSGEGEDGAILRVQGMPSLDSEHVYQAWLRRDGTMVPQPTFEVGEAGGGAVAVPDDISGAEAILVTREPRGGARAPSERPVLTVPL
ncbi:MAG: anti-sigma factor domain-containing protein [Thermoleophilaceae bacterium]